MVYEGTQPILAELSTERVFESCAIYKDTQTTAWEFKISDLFASCAVYEGSQCAVGVDCHMVGLRAV